jgi:predicted DNA-binding transcriptional regulator YafY
MPLRPIPRPKLPRVGRPTGKFTQNRRLEVLREQLETHGAGLTLDDLASALRITTRSVRRYLRELSLIREIESIPLQPGGAHVWRIKPSDRGRTVALRRTQAYGLLATRRIFDVLKGSALFDEIDLALRQVEQIARRPAARPGARPEASGDTRIEERFAFVPALAPANLDRSEDVDEAFQALSELRVLRFRYRDREARDGRDGKERRDGRAAAVTAHPYALVLHPGGLTCVAHDVDRGETRGFAFERMSELQSSAEERFELPADFSLNEWLQGDFGVGRAPRALRMLVEFDPPAAEAVRARRVHPSQKVAVAADGRVRASLTVPQSPDVVERVRRWLLGFGASARVLEPRELADEIARELRRAAERYSM